MNRLIALLALQHIGRYFDGLCLELWDHSGGWVIMPAEDYELHETVHAYSQITLLSFTILNNARRLL